MSFLGHCINQVDKLALEIFCLEMYEKVYHLSVKENFIMPNNFYLTKLVGISGKKNSSSKKVTVSPQRIDRSGWLVEITARKVCCSG